MLFSYSGPILMYNEFEKKKMQGLEFMSDSRCLKTIEKVSFNIASYVYIKSGQKYSVTRKVNFN